LNAALVVVATPASEHVVPAGWGLARGAWVLVEKPVATTITEARALADPRVRVGYSERSHPALAELAASRFSALRFERSVPGAHGDPVALDLLVHDLDLLRRLGVEVGEILRCEGGHDGLDLRIGGLRGADRIDVWMRCGRRGPPRRRLVASIGDRELEIDLTLRSESGPDPLTVQWRAFVDEARGGARRLATGAEAADDVALVQEILNRCALTS
jgi:predicted dehydrogenase